MVQIAETNDVVDVIHRDFGRIRDIIFETVNVFRAQRRVVDCIEVAALMMPVFQTRQMPVYA
jgi:hypothetical protein